MKKSSLLGAVCVYIACLYNPSTQAALVDNFNDGMTTGWTTHTESTTESGGLFKSGPLSGPDQVLATMDGQNDSTVGVDAVLPFTGGPSNVGLILNFTSLSDHLFVKIQDNNGNGLFDRLYFYHGDDYSPGVAGIYYFDLSFEFKSTYFEVTDNGDGTVTATVETTGEIWTKTLLNSYAGTGVGLGFYGEGAADNFYISTYPIRCDLNNNDVIDAGDALQVLRMIFDDIPDNLDCDFNNGGVGDGIISAADYLIMVKIVLGIASP